LPCCNPPLARARRPFVTTWFKGFREQNRLKRFYNGVMVRFAGLSDDLPAALAVSAAAVFASTQPEGALSTLMAAQAMGVPVAASDLAAGSGLMLSPPAVGEGRMTGLRFPAGDIDAMAGALTHLRNLSEAERRTIGVRGRAWVSSLGTPAAVAERTLHLYMELVQGRRP